MKNYHYFPVLLACLQFIALNAEGLQDTAESKHNIYESLADSHLPTMAQAESKEAAENSKIEQYNDELKDKWFNIGETVQIPALGNVEKLRRAYLIFGAQHGEDAEAQWLNQSTVQDLELFSGNKAHLQRNLLALFEPYLHTAVGKVQLQKMLCQPLVDKDQLEQRQERIQLLLNNTSKLEALHASLQKLTASENEILWFWKNIGKSTFNQLEKDAIPTLVPLSETTMKVVEKSPLTTETLSRGSLAVKTILTNPMVWLVGFFGYSLCTRGFSETGVFLTELIGKAQTNPSIAGFWATYLLLGASIATYQNIKETAAYNAATNGIHAKMNSAALFMETARELLGNDALKFDSQEAASLVDLLDSSTFKSDPSFFSYKGRAVTAFTMMSELKNHFTSMLEQIGQLDAHVAIARFMQAQQNNKSGKFCFPTYINNDTPQLSLNEYWHPFLNADTVVTNDIELGGNNAQTIIVTGPNAGGKSTALKGMTMAVVLALTLGIAPARSMTLTPFKIISTYMNIADDAGSESLFQAEMHRASGLINLVKNHTGKDFIFVVMDELFTGTNPLEGKSAAYGVIKKLITYKNSILVFVTHFKELTELEAETNGAVKNFKVWVNNDTTHTGGRISYPYKMAPGISDQAIALDLLAEEGFDPEILQHSYNMLNRLKKNN